MASIKKRLSKTSEEVSTSSLSSQKDSYEVLKAWVRYIVYPKEKKINKDYAQFYVLSCENPYNKRKIKVVGHLLNTQVGDYFEFKGKWTKDKKGNDCFEFVQATRAENDEFGCTSLLSYLFGPKNAQKIINHYNDALIAFETFKYTEDTFRTDMVEVKGIGPKIIDKAQLKYSKSLEVEKIYQTFFKFNLSVDQALRVVKQWGQRALDIINQNAYNLLNIDGFNFETVDNIALNYYHIGKEDKRRIKAIIVRLLKMDSQSSGNCYMPLNGSRGLIQLAQKELDISSDVIRENVIELKKNKTLETEILGLDTIVFLKDVYDAECQLSQVVASLIRNNLVVKKTKIESMIADYETLKGFSLAEKQREAIRTSAINQFSIISGPPGSGKTTIVDAICQIFKQSKKNIKIKLCAPTGRAAKRMMESTGIPASTIHRLLGYTPQGFKYDENNPLPDVDVLIIDEFSMCDLKLAHKLMMAISINTIVIIVGDANQLPSVDSGQVLNDLLKVPYIPKTVLNEIYRQKDGSTVLQRALNFNEDDEESLKTEVDLTEADDFHFIEEEDIEEVKASVLELYLEQIKKYGVENVCLLDPQNVGALGTEVFNKLIQDTINPHTIPENELVLGKRRTYRINDRVIQLKNQAEDDIYNGMIGTVVDIKKGETLMDSTLTVDFGDDIEHVYPREEFSNLQLAYATTVHKAQGSEMMSVIQLMDKRQSFMNRKNLVYTGWTRVKNELHIVGQKEMVEYARRNKDDERLTRLVARFMEYEPAV